MKGLIQFLTASIVTALNIYGTIVFGFSSWSVILAAAGGFIFLSLFLPKLDLLVCLLSRIIGVAALVAAMLLLVAGTIGGSFHLSESNEVLLVGLLLLGVVGCAMFLFKIKIN